MLPSWPTSWCVGKSPWEPETTSSDTTSSSSKKLCVEKFFPHSTMAKGESIRPTFPDRTHCSDPPYEVTMSPRHAEITSITAGAGALTITMRRAPPSKRSQRCPQNEKVPNYVAVIASNKNGYGCLGAGPRVGTGEEPSSFSPRSVTLGHHASRNKMGPCCR